MGFTLPALASGRVASRSRDASAKAVSVQSAMMAAPAGYSPEAAPSLMPSSRATFAIGSLVSRTSRTAPRLKSSSKFRHVHRPPPREDVSTFRGKPTQDIAVVGGTGLEPATSGL